MKISGGAWKLVLAGFCAIGVWFNFLLGNIFPMIFWLACIFGLIVWYGWTYQDRKAEYDETRAKIAQTEEHLREMQEEMKKVNVFTQTATHSVSAHTDRTSKTTSNAKDDLPTTDNNDSDEIVSTINAQRIIHGAPLKYKYEIPLESADEDAIYAAYLAGQTEYKIGSLDDDAAEILAEDKPIGVIRERIDMLQDWEDRGDPYRIYLAHCGNGDNRISLLFYRDRRKMLDWKEQSVVTLVGYKGEDEQFSLIDAVPGDELELVDDYDDKLNHFTRVDFDGCSIGRLPKSTAEKFGEHPRADAFIERIDTDSSGNSKPVIRIFW